MRVFAVGEQVVYSNPVRGPVYGIVQARYPSPHSYEKHRVMLKVFWRNFNATGEIYEDDDRLDHAGASEGFPAHGPTLQQTLADLEDEILHKPNHAMAAVTVGRLRDVLHEMDRLVKIERSARNLLRIGYEFDWAPGPISEYVDALDRLIGVP